MPSDAATAEQWERYKPVLEELWVKQRLSTAKVIEEMKQRYGFNANKNKYDRQFRDWGWRKNLKSHEWLAVEHKTGNLKREPANMAQVVISGVTVKANKRARRHYHNAVERSKFLKQHNAEVPSYVTICQPEDLVIKSIDFTNLPSVSFLSQIDAPLCKLALGSMPLISVSNTNTPNSHRNAFQALTTAAGTDAALPDNQRSLQALLCSFANNLHDRDTFGKAVDIVFTVIRDLSIEFAVRMLQSIKGPTMESFCSSLCLEAFRRDEEKIARTLLSLITADINAPMHEGGNWCAKPVLMADLVRSSALAQIFLESGGDFSQSTTRFLTKVHERSSIAQDQKILLFTKFIEERHGAVESSLDIIFEAGGASLTRLVLDHFNLGPQAYVTALLCTHGESVHEEARQTLGDIYGLDWLQDIGPKLLATAACNGFTEVVQFLLALDVEKDEVVDVDDLDICTWKRHFFLKLELDEETDEETNEKIVSGTATQYAIIFGHIAAANLLLDAGAEIGTSVSREGIPAPLFLALAIKNSELANRILDLQDTYQHEPYESTASPELFWHMLNIPKEVRDPISLAMKYRDSAVVRRLLGAGYNLNADLTHDTVCSPLSNALLYFDEWVPLFLDLGATLTVRQAWAPDLPALPFDATHSSLAVAIYYGKFDLVEPYIRGSQDTDAIGICEDVNPLETYTPLTVALGYQDDCIFSDNEHHHEIAVRLMGYYCADVVKAGLDPSPLVVASQSGCLECVEMILSRLHDQGVRLRTKELRAALKKPNLDIAHALLHFHFDRDNSRDQCSGDYACLRHIEIDHERMKAVLFALLSLDDGEKRTLLLAKNLRLNWKAPCIAKILHTIEYRFQQQEAILDWALEAGADLTLARMYDSERCCNMGKLLDFESEMSSVAAAITGPSFPYRNDYFASEVARDALIRKLLQHGADPDSERTILYGSRLRTQKSVLRDAACEGKIDILRELISYGGNLHRPAQGLLGRTVLQEASENGHQEIVEMLLNEHKVSPNEPPSPDEGLTALQCAAANGHLLVARDLIQAGALVNGGRAEIRGHTALEVAARFGRLDMVQLLLDAGADISDSEFGQEQFDNAVGHAKAEGFPVLARHLEEQREKLHGNGNGSERASTACAQVAGQAGVSREVIVLD